MSEPNFFAFLTGLSGVQSTVASRVYPDKLPQNPTLPAIVFQRVGGARARGYCGTDRLVSGSYQFDVYGRSRSEARQIAQAVMAESPEGMLDYSGLMGNVRVKDCALTSDFDSIDPEPGLLKRTQLWDVWYVERSGGSP